MRTGEFLLRIALAGVACVGVSAAQSVDVILKNGDTVLGMGGVSQISTIAINDSKSWVSLVDTTWPDTTRDLCVLRNGFPTLREGVAMLSPEGATLFSWSLINFNRRGDLGMLLKIRPTSGPTLDGVYWNLKEVLVKGALVGAAPLPADATWESVSNVKFTDENLVLVMGQARIGTTKLDLLVGAQLDAAGDVVSRTVLALQGQEVPALGTNIAALQRAFPTGLAVNAHGDFLCYIEAVGTGSSMMLNAETIVAQEGAPSPVPGRSWQSLKEGRVAINDRGDTVISGTLQGTTNNYLIAVNGAKFVQAGDVIPTFSTSPIATAEPAPLNIGNNGDVYWRAQDDAGGGAFMRNLQPIVIEGSTVIDGALVTKLEKDHDAFSSSRNGRFFAGVVELPGSTKAVVFADFGLVLDIPGCHGNPGRLTRLSGDARVGDHLELAMDDGQAPGALAKIVFATRERIAGSECGALTPFGEVLTSPGHRIAYDFLPPWKGTGPTSRDYPIPNDLALVDATFFLQGYFRMPGTRNVRLTNGLRIEFGPP